ncbi:WD repeat domain-containing protein 83, partial [Tanacetum coccineum]
MDSKHRRRSVEWRPPAVLTAKFSNNGNFFITGGGDGVLRIWDSSQATLSHEFKFSGTEHRDICLTKDDLMLASCGDDGQVMYWDLSTQCLVRSIGRHAGL